MFALRSQLSFKDTKKEKELPYIYPYSHHFQRFLGLCVNVSFHLVVFSFGWKNPLDHRCSWTSSDSTLSDALFVWERHHCAFISERDFLPRYRILGDSSFFSCTWKMSPLNGFWWEDSSYSDLRMSCFRALLWISAFLLLPTSRNELQVALLCFLWWSLLFECSDWCVQSNCTFSTVILFFTRCLHIFFMFLTFGVYLS